uniref:Uncharacterized protein n=1 Tax=Anguilla anguilla TaxID=7936 RepID=A0A0E9S5D2_ANGAN
MLIQDTERQLIIRLHLSAD